MKNTSLLFFLISTCIPTQKEMSRDTFIQDATSHFANGDDFMLIREEIFFMLKMWKTTYI